MKKISKKIWGKIKAAARWTREIFPFTAMGLLLLGGSAAALLYYGIKRIDLVLLVIGAIGLALGALSVLTVLVTTLVLWLRLRKAPTSLDPLHLECGFATRTGFSISKMWWVPFVRVLWTWIEPEGIVRQVMRGGRRHEEICPTRRCLADHIVRRIEVGDVFGFAKMTFRAREQRAVRFTPSMGALKTMHVVRSMAGGSDIAHPQGPAEGERIDMRNYTAGDPIRFVLWKVFARSRELVVRTPERALSPVRQTVAYLVTGAGDEPAAGAARVAIDCGALGNEWVMGADGVPEYAKASTHALEVLARSAKTVADDGGTGLAKFLATAVPGSVGRAVVFVPARPGPWLKRVVAAARQRSSNLTGSPVEFVVCADGIERAAKPSLLKRALLSGKAAEVGEVPADADPRAIATARNPPVHASELTQVVDALTSARAKVLIVDRRAGRVFADGHRRALEAA